LKKEQNQLSIIIKRRGILSCAIYHMLKQLKIIIFYWKTIKYNINFIAYKNTTYLKEFPIMIVGSEILNS
jgi:hypothetical protein